MSTAVLRYETSRTRPAPALTAPPPAGKASLWPAFLYAAVVLLTCAWVLSLPLFPSQDGPLHLYYVQIFRELLTHQHTPYTHLFAIRHYLPPYASYYYALIGLGRFVSLETADKLFAVGNIAFFAAAGHYLLRSLYPRTRWAPFLLLPVLLNWPLFMGFANYMLSINFALLALACWCRAAHRSGWRYTVLFLALVGCMILTHPLPWAFTLGFASLELLLRIWRLRAGRTAHVRSRLWRDLLALTVTGLSYLYLLPFRAPTQRMTRLLFNPQRHTWEPIRYPSILLRLGYQALGLLHTQGINLFQGTGPAHVYRVGIALLLGGSLLLALASLAGRGLARWQLPDTWLLYAALLILGLILVPDDGIGGYYVTTRMQLLVYICCVVAAAPALERRPRLAVSAATVSVALALLTLGLAVRYIGAAARTIASLRDLPLPADASRPGLLMRPAGIVFPAELNYDAYTWAPVHYFRWRHLVLYNTAWLGDRLIPIAPTAAALSWLDPTFFNQDPGFGDRPLRNNTVARRTLSHAGFVLLQHTAVPPHQAPFAELSGDRTPAPYAQGWSCPSATNIPWLLCRPGFHAAQQP